MTLSDPVRRTMPIPRARILLSVSLLPMAAGLLLRLPGIAEPVGIDQGIFLTAGWGLQRGLSLYRDLWDQKPPGIHLTYLLGLVLSGGRVSAIAWLDILAAAVTTVLLFDIGRRRIGWGAGVVAGTTYAWLTLPAAIYNYGGFLERAVPESFVVLLVTAAVWLAFAGPSVRPRVRALAVGVLAGAAVVFKPTAVLFAPIVGGAWLIGRAPADRARSAAPFVAGLAVVPTVVFLWLAASGTLGDAWIALVEYNRSYLSEDVSVPRVAVRFGQETMRRLTTQPLWAAGAFAFVSGLYRQVRARRVESVFAVACCWLAAALAGGAASGIRVFNAYFIPSQPALALMVATLAVGTPGPSRRWRTLVLAGAATLVAIGAGWRGHFVPHLAAATSADVRALWSGHTDSPQFLDRFGGFLDARGYSARANAELADWIRGHTTPADRIYIFGMAPSVYFLSQRLPSNRFLFVYPPLSGYVARPAFTLEGLAADLARVPPRVFVLDRQDRDSRSGWRAVADFAKPPVQALLADYDLQAVIGNFSVYVRPR